VLKRHGRDLETLATAYARVAAFVENEVGNPDTLLCDPKGAARRAITTLEGDT
jgi:hypothetical protein